MWLADGFSQLGSRVGLFAVPLLAAEYLRAGAFEVSLLRVLQTAPFLLLGLVVGAWCDRIRLVPGLVAADAGRAVALAAIPVAAVFGGLTLELLCLVMMVSGALGMFFDIGHKTCLPRLLEREQLVAANARLSLNVSVAAVAAPAVAGVLFQWVGGPVAMLVTAVCYVVSAVWLRRVRVVEVAPPRRARRRLGREIGEALGVVFRDPVLRAVGLHGACLAACQSAATAISVLFLLREVGVSAAVIGLVSAVGIAGSVLASGLARRIIERLGRGRVLWVSGTVCGAGFLLYPLTFSGVGLVFFGLAGVVTSFCLIVLHVATISYQQETCPAELLGRVTATMRFLVWGAIPVGSLLGGVLAEGVGLRATLWVTGGCACVAALWLVCSPLVRHAAQGDWSVQSGV